MLKISQIPVSIGDTLDTEHIVRKLHARPSDILSYTIERESLDARKNEELHFSYTVWAEVRNEEKYARRKDVTQGMPKHYELPDQIQTGERPVVVGFGPAGMYAALILAECGARPIVIERGKPVEERAADVDAFFKAGILKPESNVQFGEGGAGTFSDGKLTTRIKNIRISKVLEEFIEAGADPKIRYEHRPHIGTDVLRGVVKKIRKKVISLGGEIRFETKLTSLITTDGKVTSVHTSQGDIETGHVILACGHSASDTYETLLRQGVEIVQKDFAAGVRVEHPQILIDENTYGKYAGHPSLGAASYQLTARTSVKRGVYSFCMCPGGVVIPASTEAEHLAVNGMSYSARDGKNANSAILVQIPRADFDHGHPLDGFTFQKELEKKAYRARYQAPASNISDYLNHQVSKELVIASSYPRGIGCEDMHALFSDPVNKALEEGFASFDSRIPGFIDQGIMVGMESRSSSPIRLPRTQEGVSESTRGLYPCGEGAGYAGGIVSSAVDGIRQAENVLSDMRREIH
jgi:uncharacterized FAD-dependent dehydrogenase